MTKSGNVDIPEAIIEKILSCLPVKSLLRFKSVSKDWNSIIVDQHFIISLHSGKSSFVIYNKREDDEFVALDQCEGLLLEQSIFNINNSRLYRIRNPETGRIVQLPNTQKIPCLRMYLAFLPSTQVFKVLSFYKDENRQNLGCEILSIGNGSTTCLWRTLELPTLEHMTSCCVSVISEVAYCMGIVIKYSQNRRPAAAIKIDVLDIENEIYITTATLPKPNFTSKNYMRWNGKVSFGKIVNDELNLLVLDDYKTNKWIEEKRIVKMKNLTEEDEPIQLFYVIDFELYFLLPKKKSFCRYNFISGKVDIVLSDYDKSKVILCRKSLYTLN